MKVHLRRVLQEENYYGFNAKKEYWVGKIINSFGREFIVVSSGKTNNTYLSMYLLRNGNWEDFWFEINDSMEFKLENLPIVKKKLKFMSWVQMKYGQSWIFAKDNRLKGVNDFMEEYDEYRYEGLPSFVRKGIIL